MLKTLSSLLLWLLATGLAAAQSTPGLITGQVPTAAQWNSYFAAKQDALGFTPCNTAGCFMSGPLTMTASVVGAAGLNVPPGVAPTSPNNGDIWVTSAGVYVQVNGSTVGPLGTGGGTVNSGTANDLAYYAGTGSVVSGLATIANGTLVTNSSGAPSISQTLPAVVQSNINLTVLMDSSFCNTQGNVLYRSATTWSCLAVGTSGQVLTTNGSAQNPSWTTISGVGTVTQVSTGNFLSGGPITSSGTVSGGFLGGSLAQVAGAI